MEFYEEKWGNYSSWPVVLSVFLLECVVRSRVDHIVTHRRFFCWCPTAEFWFVVQQQVRLGLLSWRFPDVFYPIAICIIHSVYFATSLGPIRNMKIPSYSFQGFPNLLYQSCIKVWAIDWLHSQRYPESSYFLIQQYFSYFPSLVVAARKGFWLPRKVIHQN